MEFVIQKEVAKALFSKASGTIPNKDVTPILKNFLIKAEKGRLRVMATDMTLGALADTTLQSIVREGITAAPAQKLLDMIATAHDGNICFRLQGATLTVLTAYQPAVGEKAETFKTQWNVHCMDPDTYPEFPSYEDAKAMVVDCKGFVAGLDRISFATANDEMKQNLMAVYINNGFMYATDRHRACRYKFDSKLSDVTIPASAVKLLIQLLRNAGVDNVGVLKIPEVDPRYLLFKVGADVYHARALEGKFPDVESVLFKSTEGYKDKLTIPDRDELKAAILRSRITAEEDERKLVLQLSSVTDANTFAQLALKSRNKIDEHCIEYLNVLWTGTSPFERTVNWEYLQDVLNVLQQKQVVVLTGEDKGNEKTKYRIDEGEFIAIIMPIRPPRQKSETEKAAEAADASNKKSKNAKKEAPKAEVDKTVNG